jgi:predicted nucleic acid-binding Zn ribbon protein
MPTYVYRVIKKDGSLGDTFEVQQRMADKPLAKHPETGEEVVRVVQAPMVCGTARDAGSKGSAGTSGGGCGSGCSCC